jgi:hypothetical protein
VADLGGILGSESRVRWAFEQLPTSDQKNDAPIKVDQGLLRWEETVVCQTTLFQTLAGYHSQAGENVAGIERFFAFAMVTCDSLRLVQSHRGMKKADCPPNCCRTNADVGLLEVVGVEVGQRMPCEILAAAGMEQTHRAVLQSHPNVTYLGTAVALESLQIESDHWE